LQALAFTERRVLAGWSGTYSVEHAKVKPVREEEESGGGRDNERRVLDEFLRE